MIGLAQINEYAHHILPPPLRNNVSVHFYNTYCGMAEKIIDNEIDRKEVGKRKRDNLALIKEVHQRATKTVFKLKKMRLADQGIDLDVLNYDKREEHLRNMQLKEEFGELDEIFQGEGRKKQQPENNLAKEMEKEKENWLAELKDKITLELKHSKQYIA
jgi:hypothetical protein